MCSRHNQGMLDSIEEVLGRRGSRGDGGDDSEALSFGQWPVPDLCVLLPVFGGEPGELVIQGLVHSYY